MASPGDKKASEKTPVLLMSIVRKLLSSSDVVQREEEKKKLEKSYHESDRRLDNMVTDHLTDLTSIIQSFSKISSRISTSQEKIRAIKDNLQSCKNLLHCKRDELRKLWIDGVENKTIFAMLDDVEKVKDVSEKLRGHMERKQYLSCTQLIATSLSVLEENLSDVAALKETKDELYVKREELYELLIDELNRQIYVKSTSSVVKGFQRQGSLRQSQNQAKVSYLRLALKNSAQFSEGLAAEEEALRSLMSADLAAISKPQPAIEDQNLDPDGNPLGFLAVLVQSLALLKRLPDAAESLRTRIKPGLLAIVQRASQQVADSAYMEGEDLGQVQQPQFLLELLELIFKQFRIVAQVHAVILANIQRIKNHMSSLGDFSLYDSSEVWNVIQSVLQLLLSDYLDIRNSAGSQPLQSASLDDTNVDIASYFLKKRPTRLKKFPLFRFDSSSHAISMNSYLREQRQEYYGSGDILNGRENVDGAPGKILYVCRLCASNITVIYIPLQNFLCEIETAMKVQPGSLALQVFLKEFVRDIYLGQVQSNIENNIYVSTKGNLDAKQLADSHTQREMGVHKPLLHHTVVVARSLQDLCDLMSDLPDYAEQFLNMICKILQDYLVVCHSAYQAFVTPNSDEKRVISANWVKDDDINRFLRSLPNWQNLKEESQEVSMSEEDLRAMNFKESSILTSNLSSGESLIPQSEIIGDVLQLRTLGNLCESTEWFSLRILNFASSLKSHGPIYILSPPERATASQGKALKDFSVSDNTVQTLQSLAQHFQDLSELCLMVLHLEVRVHCFHHLLQISQYHAEYHGVIDKMEPDENVTKLNKDLCSIEETMQQAVIPKKFKYIFEGLGHLVSTILINSSQFLKRINENGIKKMCRNIFAVQQCLTNITANRESDLDHARQYYELLYQSTDEIIISVLQNGPHFTELEYVHLLELISRSYLPKARYDVGLVADTGVQRMRELFAKIKKV